MTEIIVAPLTRFRKEQHLGLMTSLDHLIMNTPVVKTGIGQLYQPFSSALAVESAAIKIEQGSLTTGKMEEQDAEREDLVLGFTHLLENGLRHFDSTKRTAAETLKHVVDKYGNFRRKTNADETVSMRGMCSELLGAEYQPHLATLADGVEWITRIQTVNEEYSALYELRNAETNGTHVITYVEARQVMDPCYNAIVKRVSSLADINGEANYLSFINQLNGFISDLKTTMAIQEAARKKQAATAPVAE
ncbi:MAG: DUF6261 family protein [Paludibacter sp.]